MPLFLLLFFFLSCVITPSRGLLWAFVPDDLGFVITGQEGSGRSSFSGKTFTNSIGMTFVQIPSGTFMMGSPSDEPNRFSDETQHRVTLTQPFYLETTEVTQGQWKAVMGSNPSRFSSCGVDCPVEQVSWNDCQDFIQKLNQREGNGTYRLPTEAEWEYACRAGTTAPYYTDLDQAGWYSGNSGIRTHPVAQKTPNAWGLYDMHGNVWEWCQDWYGGYPGGSVTDPKGPSSGPGRVFRGGCWLNSAGGCRSAGRGFDSPGYRDSGLGFRVAWTK